MKELSENIRRWFKEKWTAQDGSPCGSYEGKGRVKCRPSKRVSSKTAQTWGEMSKSEKRKAVRTKQKAHKKGHQFSSHKTGKTWKGTKYKPKKTKLKEGVEVDQSFLKNFVMDAIKNPRKFYTILLLTGMKSSDAYRIVYNLKYPRKTSANFETKMRMLHLLQNIIELITKDRILYSRIRSMATSGELEHIGKNVAMHPIQKRRKSSKNIIENEGMSIGNSEIAGVTDQPPPVSPIMMFIRRAMQSKLSKKNKNRFNSIIHQ